MTAAEGRVQGGRHEDRRHARRRRDHAVDRREPALAGSKKKPRKAAAANATAGDAAPAPRRLYDELGLGIVLATPTAPAAADAEPADDAARADAVAPAAPAADGPEGPGGIGAIERGLFDRDRRSSTPSGDGAIRFEAEPLTLAQVGQVVKANAGDLEYCWRRVPPARRADGAVSLQLTIAPRGTVTALAVGGEPNASFVRCMERAAARWRFPIADTTSIVEYPVVLR